MPKTFTDPEAIADDIIRDVGRKLVVGLPLGLGKANHIVNALYARAAADRSIDLTFFSALTLEKPKPGNLLESRFITPVIDRLFGGYPDLAYADPLRHGKLPSNIRVIEFFFLAGRWLHVAVAQQNYISANYTHAASYLLASGLNVVAQLVAKRVVDGVPRYSLSCNTDTTLDMLKARGEGRANFRLAAQVNSEMPFMPGPGDLPADSSAPCSTAPRPISRCSRRRPSRSRTPNMRSACMPQAWCVTAARCRSASARSATRWRRASSCATEDNARFREIMTRLAPGRAPAESGPFDRGLYGVSEMVTEAFIGLIDAGILKRAVDGMMLHGAFFLVRRRSTARCVRWRGGASRASG